MAKSLGIRFRNPHRKSSGVATTLSGNDNGSSTQPSESIPDSNPAGDERTAEPTDIWQSTGDDGIIDPATLTTGSDTGTGTGTRRRGRPRGSKNSGKDRGRDSQGKATKNIEKMFFSGHMMMAAFLKTPEFIIDTEESKALSEAISTVAELYPIPLLDEKSQAWIALAMCAGGIYGPRVIAVVNNKKKNRPQVVQPISRGIL